MKKHFLLVTLLGLSLGAQAQGTTPPAKRISSPPNTQRLNEGEYLRQRKAKQAAAAAADTTQVKPVQPATPAKNR